MKKIILSLLTVSTLSACYIAPLSHAPHLKRDPETGAIRSTFHYSARLYPTNSAAQRYGMGNAEIDSSGGRSIFTASLGTERFSGEATRDASLSGNQGVANGVSSRGVYLNCRYAMNGANGKGNCTTSDQAQFDMHIVLQ
ncbi:MAG: hypothetical protein Q4B71_05335 [Cardiobacteriaceae bacterium]|nr:hypothetical protein [Cardiobacteriaceae bacterium]